MTFDTDTQLSHDINEKKIRLAVMQKLVRRTQYLVFSYSIRHFRNEKKTGPISLSKDFWDCYGVRASKLANS